MKNLRLREKFIIVTGMTIMLVSVIFMVWFQTSQRQQMQDELVEKARVMTREMDAVWEFIEINQRRINYTSSGVYEFKGLYCSIVGKSVGALFSRNSDYEFHYTSMSPRNLVDMPDEFEKIAMQTLLDNPKMKDYYEITDFEGKQVFRYVSELTLKESCLDCHGEPAGTIDVTGYEKEGLKLGEVAGAISIVMPIDMYETTMEKNLISGFLIFLLLVVLISVILYITLSRLVIQPLNHLQAGLNEMKTGHANTAIDEKPGDGEMNDLIRNFNEMAQELNQLYDHLEEQVKDRTAELVAVNHQLEETNERLQKENRSKSDFLTVMTHELRTPLSSIITFAEFLLENEDSRPDEENDNLRRIHQNGKRLLETINNTLNIFRMEADEMQLSLETIEIYDIIHSLKEWSEPLLAKKQIQLTTQIEKDIPLFNADFEMLYHSIENLLSNAIKFTDEGGEIALTAAYLADAQQIAIRVTDNGIGIASEHLDSIFDKFVQMDTSASKRCNGSGLGLTLVKNWIQLHGGTVTVESTLGQGSRFTVTIPANL